MAEMKAAIRSEAADEAKVNNVQQILDQLELTLTMQDGTHRYTVYDEIGRGGVARVFFGLDKALQREVAIKCLRKRYLNDQGAIAHFLNEAKINAMLDHPGIVPVYDIGLMGNCELFFSMEKVQGKTFREILEERRDGRDVQRSMDDLLEIFQQVCQIVGYAHSKGVVHRDLKPENIMVGDFGTVYVMDWGIARDIKAQAHTAGYQDVVGEKIDITALLDARKVKGTPKYMSPEQVLGVSDVDYTSDVFSLGLLLYEILSGQHPYANESMRDLMHAIKKEAPPPLTSFFIPNDVRSICLKALEKLPENRYPHAGELAADIHRSRSLQQVSAHRDNLLIRFWKLSRRHHVASVATILLLIGGTALGYTLLRYERRGDQEFNELITMAHTRQRAAAHCDQLILDWQRASVTPEIRRPKIERLRARRNTQLAAARALLCVAMKKHGRQLPESAIIALKQTWFEELQYYMLVQDDRSARSAFYEMRDYLHPDAPFMNWTEDEQKMILRYRQYLFPDAQAGLPR